MADLLFNVAYSYKIIGEQNEAERIYLELLDKNSSPSICNNLGVIYEEKSQLDKAEFYFDKE